MATSTLFTFAQVRSAFQSSLIECESAIQDQSLPEPCAAVGRLLMRMGFDGLDFIAREHIDGLALSVLDQSAKKGK